MGELSGHEPKGPPADIDRMLRKLPKGPAPGAVRSAIGELSDAEALEIYRAEVRRLRDGIREALSADDLGCGPYFRLLGLQDHLRLILDGEA